MNLELQQVVGEEEAKLGVQQNMLFLEREMVVSGAQVTQFLQQHSSETLSH